MRIVPPHNSVLSIADTFVRDDFCQFKLRVWVWNSRRQQPRTQTLTCTQMSSGSRFNSSQARLSVSVRESDCLPKTNDSWHTHTHTPTDEGPSQRHTLRAKTQWQFMSSPLKKGSSFVFFKDLNVVSSLDYQVFSIPDNPFLQNLPSRFIYITYQIHLSGIYVLDSVSAHTNRKPGQGYDMSQRILWS